MWRKAKFWTVNVCRILLAATFLFSGFVKANDPIGTSLKIDDYLVAMGVPTSEGLITLATAIGLAFAEFALGVCLLLALNRRTTASLTLAFMSVMTALTVWIYVAEPVSDCGCFGDAIVLTNGETLIKNIVLLAAAWVVMKWHKLMKKVLGENNAWLLSLPLMVAPVAYACYCVYALPVIDFRPYKVGTKLWEKRHPSGDEAVRFEVVMVYEKDGKRMEIGIDDDEPDSTWTYIETRRELMSGNVESSLSELYIIDSRTGEDIVDDILQDDGSTLLLIAPDLDNADQGCAGDVNVLFDYAQKHGIGFYCITASGEASQSRWCDYTGAEYTFHESDERVLKTIVRANPGLVLLHGGTVVRKWSNWNLPQEEELEIILKL